MPSGSKKSKLNHVSSTLFGIAIIYDIAALSYQAFIMRGFGEIMQKFSLQMQKLKIGKNKQLWTKMAKMNKNRAKTDQRCTKLKFYA